MNAIVDQFPKRIAEFLNRFVSKSNTFCGQFKSLVTYESCALPQRVKRKRRRRWRYCHQAEYRRETSENGVATSHLCFEADLVQR